MKENTWLVFANLKIKLTVNDLVTFFHQLNNDSGSAFENGMDCRDPANFTRLHTITQARRLSQSVAGVCKTRQSSTFFKLTWTSFLLVITWHYAYRLTPAISEPSLYSGITSHLTGSSHVFSRYTRDHKYAVWQSVYLLLLMEAQVLRRLFESIYVFKYGPSARMHILGYLTGLFFYTAAPLSVCCKCASELFKFVADLVAEVAIRGKERIQVAEFDWWGHVNPLLHLRWYMWIGGAIFLWGWNHQRCCHAILGSLREDKEQDNNYSIPHGDWFEYVSSPHYLAEIVIYGGIVIASGCSDVTIWFLFGFVVANLAFAAKETHKWYMQKFDNYPKSRFAIFPFVY